MELQTELRVDSEFHGVIPPLTENERKGLERKLLSEGFDASQGKILLWGDTIVDGHNRYEICRGNNEDGLVLDYETEQVEFAGRADAIQWIILNSVSQRNIDPVDKAQLVESLLPVEQAAAKERQRASGGDQSRSKGEEAVHPNLDEPVKPERDDERGQAVEKAANKIGVKKNTVYRVRRVKRAGRDDLLEQVRAENLSLNAAVRIVELYEKLSPEVAEGVEDLAHAGELRIVNDAKELNRLAAINQRSLEEALEVVDVIAGEDKPEIRSVYAAEKYLANKHKSPEDPSEQEKAVKKFEDLQRRLYELAQGIEDSGGLSRVMRNWPEQNQRIYAERHRELGRQIIEQAREFQTEKGGDLN